MTEPDRTSFATCTVTFLFGLILAVNATAQPAFTEATVRGVVQSMEISLNERDWQSYGALFSEEGDVIIFDSRRFVGPTGVESLMSEEWAETPADVTAKLTPVAIRLPNRDLAIVTVEAEFAGSESTNRDRAILVITNSEGGPKIEAKRVFDAQE